LCIVVHRVPRQQPRSRDNCPAARLALSYLGNVRRILLALPPFACPSGGPSLIFRRAIHHRLTTLRQRRECSTKGFQQCQFYRLPQNSISSTLATRR
jgi:hypothetical protein